MNSVEIILEQRSCVNCGMTFKVMQSSKTKTCSTMCAEYGMPVRGEQKKAPRENVKKTENIKVTYGTPTRPIERQNAFLASALSRKNPTYKERLKEKQIENGIIENEISLPKEKENGLQETKRDNLRIKGNIMPKTETLSLQKYSKEETKITQAGHFDQLSENLEAARSDMLTLQKSSANRLMKLMETVVSDTDIQKSNDGVKSLEMYKVEMAIKCANAITGIVQANVNLLKAITKAKN